MAANKRRPHQSEGGAGSGWTADTILSDQGEMFTASRGAYGNVSYSEPAAPQPITGPARRDLGQRRTAQTVGGEQWLRLAERDIEDLAKTDMPFTGETVRARTGEPPNANLVGVAIRRARIRGLIVADGTSTAQRPEAHSRLIQVWIGRSAGEL